ncbi:hypothetical protein FRC17_008213 [Serendipita sp. 399]|nr:hypothetical protein FRC17_008213 [Serendipita sp. 399]
MNMNQTATSGSSLRPLSLPQKSLSIRSVSPTTPSMCAPSSTSSVASPEDARGHIQPFETPETSSSSATVAPSTPGIALQRHHKRYSTLSYTNSPRSPHAPTAFQSPIVANFSHDGSEARIGVVAQPANGTLSRSSSRGSVAGHRISMERSILTKRSSVQLESYEVTSQATSQIMATPVQTEASSDKLVTSTENVEDQDSNAGSPDANVVLTLAEKHADLLQFIAQKEAKCLELRTQLATQEVELKALKAKWTSIVQRATPISSHGTSSPGGISLATVGRLFSNVTAPLASALDALDPLYVPNTGDASPQKTNGPSDSQASNTPASNTRGHTPSSSARSSASSFAHSRNSISSLSSLSVSSSTDITTPSQGLADVPTACPSPSTTKVRMVHRTSLLMPHLINANLELSTLIGLDEDASSTSNESKTKSGSSWLPDLESIGIPSASTLNKKWEEIQKGET